MSTAHMQRRTAVATHQKSKADAAMDRTIKGILDSLKGVKGLKAETINRADLRKIDCASTGIPEIDDFLTGELDAKGNIIPGSGRGAPRGRFVEVFGPESSGKTTLGLKIIAAAQARGEVCAFIDAEHALDYQYASSLGVDIEKLIIVTPDYGEQALDAVTMLIPKCRVIVFDSIDAIEPKKATLAKVDGGKAGFGGDRAKLLSAACRKGTKTAGKEGTLVIWTNQIRMKIGVMFGNPENTSGGNAMKYYASLRIDVRRGAALKNADGNTVGTRMKMKIIKNKVAPTAYREMFVDIRYGKGITIPTAKQVAKDRAEAKARWQSGGKK